MKERPPQRPLSDTLPIQGRTVGGMEPVITSRSDGTRRRNKISPRGYPLKEDVSITPEEVLVFLNNIGKSRT